MASVSSDLDPALEHALGQLTERIHTAIQTRTPLRIRGAGSKDFYAHAPRGELLDTRSLRGILSYEPSELVVTVAAGTPLQELESVLAAHGQCLPFEPPQFTWSVESAQTCGATVGGMLASGLAGPARVAVGGVRDYVLGLNLVNGRGERLRFGGQVMKNVAGYDVSRLMVGAMGTLGLVTQVSLKVLPIAPAQASLVFELPQHTALAQLQRWGAQALPLNASCWVPMGHDSNPNPPGHLWLRLRGAVAAVEAASQRMLGQQAGQRQEQARATVHWAQCRDQQLPFFQRPENQDMALWRLSVPPSTPVLDLPWPTLVEWHGGLRWLWAPHAAAPQLHNAAHAAGGFARIFVAARAHAASAGGIFPSEDGVAATISRRLKDCFDPAGIFNPGCLGASL